MVFSRSNAKLRLGDAKGALADAEAACERCPEYLKGHARRAEAFRRLGLRCDEFLFDSQNVELTN